MEWEKRVEANPEVMVGKPVIKGTRLTVDFIIKLLAQGWNEQQILKNYPQLKEQDIRAALEYSASALERESLYAFTKSCSHFKGAPPRSCKAY